MSFDKIEVNLISNKIVNMATVMSQQEGEKIQSNANVLEEREPEIKPLVVNSSSTNEINVRRKQTNQRIKESALATADRFFFTFGRQNFLTPPFCVGYVQFSFLYLVGILGILITALFLPRSLCIIPAMPPLLICAFAVVKSRKRLSFLQIIYISIGSLLLCIPFVILAPLIRAGCIISVRYLQMILMSKNSRFLAKTSFFIWKFVDVVIYRVIIFEIAKYIFMKRFLENKKHFFSNNLKGYVVYTIIFVNVMSTVNGIIDSLQVGFYMQQMQSLFLFAIRQITNMNREPDIRLSIILFATFGVQKYIYPVIFICYYCLFYFFFQTFNAVILSTLLFKKTYFFDVKAADQSSVSPLKILVIPVMLHGTTEYIQTISRAMCEQSMLQRSLIFYKMIVSRPHGKLSLVGKFLISLCYCYLYYYGITTLVLLICFFVAFFLARYWYSEIYEKLKDCTESNSVYVNAALKIGQLFNKQNHAVKVTS